jgi:hypothetical protein
MAMSVRQRLLDYARRQGLEFQLVLGRYAVERFLYRLDQSSYRDSFVVKGALLFLVWEGEMHRMTRDLDLLGFGAPTEEELERGMRAICSADVPDDGVIFQPDSVRGTRIRDDQEYGGVRITLDAFVGTARIPMQIDIGLGDAITPDSIRETFPAILDFPAPNPRVYPRESVVAEKFQAMVLLGITNSRMKDFYDVWFLARKFSFEGGSLTTAIQQTFERRRTDIPTELPLALADAFARDPSRRQQWNAFLRKAGLRERAPLLNDVVEDLASFLMPPAQAAAGKTEFDLYWSEAGPWAAQSEKNVGGQE